MTQCFIVWSKFTCLHCSFLLFLRLSIADVYSRLEPSLLWELELYNWLAGSNSEAIQCIMLKLTMGECLNRRYVRTRFHPNPRGSGIFCVDLTWNDPYMYIRKARNHKRAGNTDSDGPPDKHRDFKKDMLAHIQARCALCTCSIVHVFFSVWYLVVWCLVTHIKAEPDSDDDLSLNTSKSNHIKMAWCTYPMNETLVHQQLSLHQLHHRHPSQRLPEAIFSLT